MGIPWLGQSVRLRYSWELRLGIHCHSASLCRFTRCHTLLSDHSCCERGLSFSPRGESTRGEDGRELVVDGRLLSRFEDLDESEKDTLWIPVPSRSAVRGLCHR